MRNFITGVNYWASNAGTDMWKNWDEKIVRKDLQILCENGIRTLRVFPNWRDFQPVEPLFGSGHNLREYRLAGDVYPSDSYYLDEVMLERFERFCMIAQELGFRLIVGLITGWMSGKLFIPPALYGRNIYTDPTALFFQQLYIRGFITRMKKQESIYAWDLGNECNCMDQTVCREEAYNWTSVIVNAIKACDPERPVISGMHSLELEGVWNIQDQGALTDMLTTHPYPMWVEHCQSAPVDDFRILLHATAQTQLYSDIGGKPCLVEEIGSMGPMICNRETEAGFLKVNLWSNWANGAEGLLWWCAHEQSELTATPYDWNMCERELGMLDIHLQPKPSLLQMKEFCETLSRLHLELPYRDTDAVCILSQGQDHWGIAYMSYILAKQAELTLEFTYCEQELPRSRLYLLPSVCMRNMSKRSYNRLRERVSEDGAILYISVDDGIFTEFEELSGFQVIHSCRAERSGRMVWKGAELKYWKTCQIDLEATRAEVILQDEKGAPLLGYADYGKGKVFFLNFPLEKMLLGQGRGFYEPYYQFYAEVAKGILKQRGIRRENPYIGLTMHCGNDADYAVLVNYMGEAQNPDIRIDYGCYRQAEPVYGSASCIEPYGACILRLKR